MPNKFLMREDAPFSQKFWQLIDETVLKVAKSHLTGRKIISVKGPFGLGMKHLSLGEEEIEPGLSAGKVIPLFQIFRSFTLSRRDIASYEKESVQLELGPLVNAIVECCKLEDRVVFHGVNSHGLINTPGVLSSEINKWDNVGQAVSDIIKAITKLDEAGFHGPYLLALSPDRYNLLFRRYDSGNQTELEHLSMMVKGIYKAPALKNCGLLLNDSDVYTSIILGQDLTVGFIGPVEDRFEFSISETLALLVNEPSSICVLKE
ncbi:MAG: hypothetical protein PWP37_98 [Thermotogota bacterium]|nr:hypothetical protein [Thermotogota bacterium]MDK2863906.1 hypothetical protein [Thermotogota bacterium]HCZ07103.1 bacteriocin [Thermotogota bacterium]